MITVFMTKSYVKIQFKQVSEYRLTNNNNIFKN